MKQIDFFSRHLREGSKITIPEPSLNSHSAEKVLWDFMKLKTDESLIFTLDYLSKQENFKRYKNMEKIRAARNYFVKEGFIICFYAHTLDKEIWHNLIYHVGITEHRKVFKDVIEQDGKEDLVLSDFEKTKIKFPELGNKIVNVSIFEHEIGFNNRYKKNNYLDHFGRSWLFHWEQTFNFWLEHYYPLIKNNLR